MSRRRTRARRGACLLLLAGAMSFSGAAEAGDDLLTPVVRVSGGPSFQVDAEPVQTALALDATAGFTGYTNAKGGLIINAELGYTFDGQCDDLHAFNLTGGVGFGTARVGVTYNPRLLLGGRAGDFVPGMRNSLVLRAAADFATFEVGHQFVSFRDQLEHDVQVMFGINPGAIVGLMIGTVKSLSGQ